MPAVHEIGYTHQMTTQQEKQRWLRLAEIGIGTASAISLSIALYLYFKRKDEGRAAIAMAPAPRTPSLPAYAVKGYVEGVEKPITVSSIGDGKFLRTDAAAAFLRMKEAAASNGIDLRVASAFRTYEEQVNLRHAYEQGRGNLAAEPGYSNHQGGISVDISVEKSYTNPVYLWLAANAGKFRFVNDVSTEPWHWTYLG